MTAENAASSNCFSVSLDLKELLPRVSFIYSKKVIVPMPQLDSFLINYRVLRFFVSSFHFLICAFSSLFSKNCLYIAFRNYNKTKHFVIKMRIETTQHLLVFLVRHFKPLRFGTV